MIGYIVDERYNKWRVKIEGCNDNLDDFTWITRLKYNKKSQKHEYDNKINISNGFIITDFCPIRLCCHGNGTFKFILNCVILDKINKLVLDKCS